jgi:predicted esterase YcpF (UPF0227 family)
MINILYIHDWDSAGYDKSSKMLKKSLEKTLGPKEFNYYSPSLESNILDLPKQEKAIKKYVASHDVDVVIASSVGALKCIHADLSTEVLQIYVNPCLFPWKMRAMFDDTLALSELDLLKQQEKNVSKFLNDDQHFFLGDYDESFNTRKETIDLIRRYTYHYKVYRSASQTFTQKMSDDIAKLIPIMFGL